MIAFSPTDIFMSKANALVCPVNCVGVMGAGLARQFRIRFPDYAKDYKRACADKNIAPGVCYMHHTQPRIISFPTKRHWIRKSQIADIYQGLLSLLAVLQDDGGPHHIALPKLGCGHGGLSWESQVRPLMIALLLPAPYQFTVYGVRT